MVRFVKESRSENIKIVMDWLDEMMLSEFPPTETSRYRNIFKFMTLDEKEWFLVDTLPRAMYPKTFGTPPSDAYKMFRNGISEYAAKCNNMPRVFMTRYIIDKDTTYHF